MKCTTPRDFKPYSALKKHKKDSIALITNMTLFNFGPESISQFCLSICAKTFLCGRWDVYNTELNSNDVIVLKNQPETHQSLYAKPLL